MVHTKSSKGYQSSFGSVLSPSSINESFLNTHSALRHPLGHLANQYQHPLQSSTRVWPTDQKSWHR